MAITEQNEKRIREIVQLVLLDRLECLVEPTVKAGGT